jgi:thioesterase domain-containing protein
LLAQGQQVAMLAIIDVPAQSPRFEYLRQFAVRLGAMFRLSAAQQSHLFLRLRHYVFRLKYFGRLQRSHKVVYLRSKLGGLGLRLTRTNSRPAARSANATQETEHTDFDALARRRIRNLFALNDQAYRAYIPRRYPGRVALIKSVRGYTGDPDKDYSPDPYIGWRSVVSGTIETYIVPGDHNEMIREPHVQLLASHLRTCLDHAQSQLNSSDLHPGVIPNNKLSLEEKTYET